MLKIIDCCRKVNFLSRNISSCKILYNEGSDKKPKRKVTETVELVTLVDQNDKILGLKPKAVSEKLARKLNFSLERVTDSKYGKTHPAYKMISAADLIQAEKKTMTTKTLKKLPLNSRISDHDLSIKIQTIRKWIAKNCEVHVTILSNNELKAMKILYNKIEEQLKNELRILDVREKENTIKFIIISPKQHKTPTATQNKEKEETIEGG